MKFRNCLTVAGAVVAFAFVGAALAADQTDRGKPLPVEPDRRTWAKPSGPDLENVFPDAARRAGVGGRSMVECLSKADGTMTDCVVLSEEPADGGFGAAALRATPKFRVRPGSPDLAGYRIGLPITWRLSGDERVTRLNETTLGFPTVAIYAPSSFYPSGAREAQIDGRAVVECTVQRERLADCAALAEAPTNKGFGAEGVRYAEHRTMRALAGVGNPIGMRARVGLYWRIRQPALLTGREDVILDRDQGVQQLPNPASN